MHHIVDRLHFMDQQVTEMEPGDVSDNQEPWYSARCIFCRERPGHPNMYEERVILLQAKDEKQAIRIAEEEAAEYAEESEGWSYTGFINLYHLFDSTIGHRTEVFSLLRTSNLTESEYIDMYYDTGSERARRSDEILPEPSEPK